MLGLGFGYDQIAAELARRYKLRPRKAYRIAYGWTLTEAAARLNARAAEQGTDPAGRASLTGSHLCDHENWPYGGRRPSVSLLLLMASVYGTNVADLLDFADHEHLPPADRLILQHAANPKTNGEPAAGYSAFGDELIRLLAERKLSQRKIAHEVPCDTGYLSKLIHGHKPPTRNIASRLEELLDADGRLLAHVRQPELKQCRKPEPMPRPGHTGRPGTDGMSVTLPYVPGRLVIEVSALDAAAAAGSPPGQALRLIQQHPDAAEAAG